MTAWLATLEPAHSSTSETLEYQAPAGSTLAGGWLELEAVAAGHGPDAYTEVAVYAPALTGTPFWSCAYGSCPQGSHSSYVGQVQIPPATGGNLYVSGACQGEENASCQEGEDSLVWANAQIKEAHLLLKNNAVPHASGFAGPLLSGEARATQELDFTATDTNGPGIYAVTVEIDSHTAYTGTPDDNGGLCASTGAMNGVLMFDSQQPCKQTESIKIPIETTGVLDGEHTLQVKVTDAAQNSSTVFAGSITTHNAPMASTAPSIVASGGVSAGVELSSTPSTWTAPTGAGTITNLYQWEQCSRAGAECQAIPGATGATYTPTAGDVGHTLKLTVDGVNNDGQQDSSSPATGLVAGQTGSTTPSGPVTEGTTDKLGGALSAERGTPNGSNASPSAKIELVIHTNITRPFNKSNISIPGRLTSTNGQPITGATIEVLTQTAGSNERIVLTHVTTAANGTFTATVPSGASRTIQLAYRAFTNNPSYAAQATVSESVNAGITLSATPRRVRPIGTITLTGRVLGSLPANGVNLALEVWFHGQWVTMHAPRTQSNGRFTLRYQFQDATGKFPFRVRTLSYQAGFPYTAGYSKKIDVRTR